MRPSFEEIVKILKPQTSRAYLVMKDVKDVEKDL